jgi:hypothetical protein
MAFLGSYPFRGDEFVYCDPPYLPSTRRRRRVYRFDLDEDRHRALLAVLKRVGCPVMLSGYLSSLYDEELAQWRRIDCLERTQAGIAMESIWLNYEPPALLHDHNHLGKDFREREAVKRRRVRIADRVAALPLVERNALLVELARLDRESFLSIAETIR